MNCHTKKFVVLKKSLYLFLSLTVCWLAQDTYAQHRPAIAFKNYKTTDGLSHNFVTSIFQDSEGIIWIATEDGLDKFNGYTFQKLTLLPRDSSSLVGNPIASLAEDREGRLWIGTRGGGVVVYDKKSHKFRHIKQEINVDDSISLTSNDVYDVFNDAQGNIWIGTGNGLNLVDPVTFQVKHYQHDSQQPSLGNNKVTSITADEEGNLWLGTLGGGVDHFNPKTGIFTHFRHEEGNPQSLSHDDVYSIFYDSQHRLWVGTWDEGLSMMQDKSGRFVHFKHNPKKPQSLSNNQILAITETDDGNIWIATDNGLSRYHEAESNFYVYKNDPFNTKGLTANAIKSLYVDAQDRLWVGTYNGGINMFDKNFIQMKHYRMQSENSALSFNDVSAVVESNNGKVWIGTDGGGLNLFDPKNGNFKYYQHDATNPKSIGSDKVKTLLLDSKQRLWIGFWGGGMDYFDQEQQTFKHFRKHKNSNREGLFSDNITAMAEDQQGYLWIGTFGGGVHKFDPEQQTFTYFASQEPYPRQSNSREVLDVLVDNQNDIWVATANGQLDLFDRDSGQFIHIIELQPGKNRYGILVLFEDSQQRLWIGLQGGGLMLFDKKNGELQTYTVKDGLPNNTINAIQEDKKGNLWLATNQGIAIFSPETGYCATFGLSDGLQELVFNQRASAHLSSGEMVFGGNNGFNMFYPDSLTNIIPEISIIFTGFQLFNNTVPVGKKESPLQADINQTDSLILNHRQSVFSLEYAGLNYTAPEKITYKYRLKEFVDESWQDAGQERKVTYTNLQPGNYQFEVVAYFNNQITDATRTLTIIVMPPWWQTWWARLFGVLFIGIMLVTIYRLRLRNIKQQNRRLENEVSDRTLKLQQSNQALEKMNYLIQEQKEEIQAQAEELAESNEEVKSINQQLEARVEMRTTDLKKSNQELDNFVYRVSHDVRAPLSSILGLVELMKYEQEEAQQKEYLYMVTRSINKLDGFVRDILDYSRNARTQLVSEPIDFPRQIDEVIEELQYMQNAQQLQINRSFDLQATFHGDPRRLHVIFRNLLSNAIKYQNMSVQEHFVDIHVIADSHLASINIKDNGIGMPADQVNKAFNMFYRGSDLSQGSGIGLYIVKETVEKLGGTINLTAELGGGTQFTLVLPQVRQEKHSEH